jgi:hypothetical protein
VISFLLAFPSKSNMRSAVNIYLIINRKFWEELTAYFPCIIISVFDATGRKGILVCGMDSTKQYNLRGCNSGITDGSDLGKYAVDGLRWNDIYTKFHEDWFGHLSNIKAVTSTIWEVAR